MLLETQALSKRFGGLLAVSAVDLTVDEGQIVGLIGSNGAGKTTLFDLITGFLRPTSGRVMFMDKDITGKKAYDIAKMGLGRTFQLANSFQDLTTLQNVVVSCHLQAKPSLLGALFRTRSSRSRERLAQDQADEILDYMGLSHVRDSLAKDLPHGYQKILSVARALALKPRMILLDEPLGGMNATEIVRIMDLIGGIRSSGITVLLVEHNMKMLDICDKAIVMNFGRKIAEGKPQEVRESGEVVEAYLGGQLAS